jgi:hypothetical protein
MKACKGNDKDRYHLIEQELKWRLYQVDEKGTGKGKEPCSECVALESFAYRPGTAGGVDWHNSPRHVIGPRTPP